MKVMVATTRTQGDLPGDYTFCVPGELLWLAMICDRDRRDPDGGCGCGRGFDGLTSHRATTTGEIVESEMSKAELRLAVRTSLTDQGWLPESLGSAESLAIVEQVAGEVLAIAQALPVGTVVRRRIDDVVAYVEPDPND